MLSAKISDILATNTKTATETTRSGDIATKEEFLKLLVTQMKNQSPLDPMDPENFAAQLAQFSSLEQLLNINSTLEKGQNTNSVLNSAINSSLAASLIGKNVKAIGNNINHTSGNEELIYFVLEKDAKNVMVEIEDGNGLVVKRMNIEVGKEGENVIEWDGKDMYGNPASGGNYTVKIIANDESGNNINSVSFVGGRVQGIRFIDGKAYLVVNGEEISLENVGEIFE